MSDLATPFSREATLEGIRTILALWLKQHEPHCDWCGTVFEQIDDLAQYADFCCDLNKLWPKSFKVLPPAKVFCNHCALGGINELIHGVRYDAREEVPF